jgi:imidazolonepropionase-like amidohydrolase
MVVSFDAMGDDAFDAMDALTAGALGVEHLSGIDFEDPAAAEQVLRKMLQVGAFAVPTFAVLDRIFSEARMTAHRKFIGSFHRRGGMVLAGSDAPTRGTPPGAGLHEELGHLVEAGLDPVEAIRAATGRAGRVLGYQGLVGTIETGSHRSLARQGRRRPLRSVVGSVGFLGSG